MITIVVSVVLITIAVPSYRNIMISNRLTAATNEFVASINMAKLEAIRRNTATQFCASNGNNGTDTVGAGCDTAAAGAVYFLDGATATKLYQAPSVSPSISLSAGSALRFNGQGLAAKVGDASPTYTGLLIDLSSNQLTTSNHRCIYITTGSTISSCSYTNTTGGCLTDEPATCQ